MTASRIPPHPTLGAATIQEFRSSLRGELILTGDEAYEGARRVWNGMIDKRPALIARCTGAADIVECIQFVRSHALRVAVRGGGHSVAVSMPGSNCDPFWSQGAYVNFMGDEQADQVKQAYGINHARLVALKNQYDPSNLLRLNHNILPTVE